MSNKYITEPANKGKVICFYFLTSSLMFDLWGNSGLLRNNCWWYWCGIVVKRVPVGLSQFCTALYGRWADSNKTENIHKLIIEGYYNGCTFHRLVKDFIVQTGDPTGTGHGGESIYGGVFKVIQFLHNIARYKILTCYRMSHIKGSNSVGVV
jgi:hypothetical protein